MEISLKGIYTYVLNEDRTLGKISQYKKSQYGRNLNLHEPPAEIVQYVLFSAL